MCEKNYGKLYIKYTFFQGFVYVSTAYSHCPRSEIKEEFYHMSISAKELKKQIEINVPK